MIMELIVVVMVDTLQVIVVRPQAVIRVDLMEHHTHHQAEQKTNMFQAIQEKMAPM